MKKETWDKVGSKFAHLTSIHPCYSHEAHFKYARIHLPVAPKCNIQCGYCVRKIDKCEYRPGVSGCIVNAEEALKRVEEARKNYPLKVVGIAGPGEVLANEESFKTLNLVRQKYPELTLCIATNGLLLTDYMEELRRLKVKAVTVTVNAINPEVGAKIYEWIEYNGKRLSGVEGADFLIKKQLEGVKVSADAGIAVKINTVLIPGINEDEVEKIAFEAKKRGAFIMNIMPLIPLYRFKDWRRPSCDELNNARQKASKHIRIFTLCRQCRADAVGIPGKEKLVDTTYFHG
ncbi:MAG: radical SAM protein [Candidatus Bathyarchaeota archaeon]